MRWRGTWLLNHGREIHERFQQCYEAARCPALRFDGVDFWVDPGEPIVQDISFEVWPRKTLIILGASGAGKSTILRLALGLIRPTRGSVWVGDFEISRMKERDLIELRQHMGLVFQEGALFDSLTLEENVVFPLVERLRLPFRQAQEKAREVLRWVGLDGHEHKLPAELSGGMRRRAGIARALVTEPSIMLYDEPTAGLDPITARTIIDLIVKLRDVRGVTSVVVTHQMNDAFRIAETQWVRSNGAWALVERTPDETVGDVQFMLLNVGRIVFYGSALDMRVSAHPYVQAFLGGRVVEEAVRR
ncbi:MAG: ATP-binding cassette domain-containing protein [Acidobacteria bacterium]|nr:ATP-binding cassette domain-containing protein [Acidobacteriota bacterium]MDW7983366.1 ATP-binding cassette domain-containing protein [Acidobacteriota bacterium]